GHGEREVQVVFAEGRAVDRALEGQLDGLVLGARDELERAVLAAARVEELAVRAPRRRDAGVVRIRLHADVVTVGVDGVDARVLARLGGEGEVAREAAVAPR